MKIVFFVYRFLKSVDEIELIIVKLINEAMTKAVTIQQMIDILEIFVDFQQRSVWFIANIDLLCLYFSCLGYQSYSSW